MNFSTRHPLILVCSLLLSHAAVAATSGPLILESQGIRIRVGSPWRDHLRTEVDGIPFIDTSRLYALRPHSGGRYYGYEDDPSLVRDTSVSRGENGRVSATLPLRAPRGEFIGTETLEILPGRQLRLAVDARLTSGLAGGFEHKIGGIFTGWLQGRPFAVTAADGTITTGLLPIQPHTQDLAQATILPRITDLRIGTPVGPLEIKATGNYPVSLIDYRMNPFFEGEPHFYLGVSERPLPPGARVQYEVLFQFPPVVERNAGRAVTVDTTAPLDVAYEPESLPDLIVPTPKEVIWGEGILAVPQQFYLRVPPGRGERQTDAYRILRSFADDCSQQYPTQVVLNESTGTLVVSLNSAAPENSPEEYRLQVGDTAELEAPTTAGLVAGLATLHQLFRYQDGKLGLRKCDITDWPSLPFRGVHFFSGRGGEETQRKMIRELVAPLKLNAVVYHCDNIQWDTHPEIKSPGEGMPKAAARAVAAEARRRHVEIVPLINTFGHCNWLIGNKRWLHLADNPENPFAYDPTHPQTYPLVHDIYQEAIELFSPKYFHIGHDEITLKGFPQSPHLQKIGARKLILDDIWHYRNWFAERGIRTMIWGDMFLGPGEACDFTLAPTLEEARLRRSGLPQDVVICDWHYLAAPAERFVSLDVLNREGFDTVASTWYHSKNITHFAKAAADRRQAASSDMKQRRKSGESLGILETTWAGYNLNEQAVQRQPDQFAAYVLTAEAGWNGGAADADELPYDYRQYFARLWNKDRLPMEKRPGWSVKLAEAANLRLETADQSSSRSLSFNALRFHESPNADLSEGVLLASRFNPGGEFPEQLKLPVETTASAVAFAVAASYAGSAEPPIAQTTITFDDGSTEGIEWKLGQNVLSLDDPRVTPGSVLLRESAGQAPQRIRVHLWSNPKPQLRIRSIDFTSTGQGSGLAVFGVAGIH